MLHSSRLFFSFIISYPPLQPSSSSDEESSDEELSDSGDTENIPNHSTTKKKRSEFDWCCCSLFFIFQISPTYSFIGKKSSKSTNVRKRRKQRKAASARVSKSPIVELSIAMVVPHKKRAQAIITNLTASNAMAKEEAGTSDKVTHGKNRRDKLPIYAHAPPSSNA